MISLRPMTKADFPLIEGWFEDEELLRWLGAYPPVDEWGKFLSAGQKRLMFIAMAGADPVGMADLEEDDTGEFWRLGFAIASSSRGRGYGQALLRTLLGHPAAGRLRTVRAAVGIENTTSIRCLRAVGFVAEGEGADANGFLHFKCSSQRGE